MDNNTLNECVLLREKISRLKEAIREIETARAPGYFLRSERELIRDLVFRLTPEGAKRVTAVLEAEFRAELDRAQTRFDEL